MRKTNGNLKQKNKRNELKDILFVLNSNLYQ